jgi:hypothetical protein
MSDWKLDQLADDLEKIKDELSDYHSISSDTGDTMPDYITEGPSGAVYATLHFYYYDPDSMRRLQECLQAPDVLLAVAEFEQWLYQNVELAGMPIGIVRNKLFDIFKDNNVKVPGWE